MPSFPSPSSAATMSSTQNQNQNQKSSNGSSASLYLFNISHISHPTYYSRPSTTTTEKIDEPSLSVINQSRLRVLHWLFNLSASQTEASYPSINCTYSSPAFVQPLMPSNRAKL